MMEIAIQHKSDTVEIDRDSFLYIASAGYEKSWLITRLFFGDISALKKNEEHGWMGFVGDNYKIFKNCHSSHLKVYVFKNTSNVDMGPHWNDEQKVLFFPIGKTDKLRDSHMVLIGQAIRDSVPDYVETETWMDQEEMRAQIRKFQDYLVAKKFCNPSSLAEYSETILGKINALVRSEEERLNEHLRPKDTSTIPTDDVNQKVIEGVVKYYDIYRNFIKSISEVTDIYDITGFEYQAATIFEPLSNKSVGSERSLAAQGFKWEPKKDSATKMTKAFMYANTMPYDFMWAVGPPSDDEDKSALINPAADEKHASIIRPYGHNARAASVLTGMLMFGCGLSADLRVKVMLDSQAVHVFRAVVSEAINNIDDTDPLKIHLQDERNPDTGRLNMKQLADSMYTWCRALMIGYAKYHTAMSDVLVGLQSRNPDGQKKRWNQKEFGLGDSGVMISEEFEPGEGTLIFADRIEFTDSVYIRGAKCLRVVLKPTVIMYEDRVYSMGRYVLEVNLREKAPISSSFLSADFISEKAFGERNNVMMAPCPRAPHTDEHINSMMHSHIKMQGYSSDDNISHIICLGTMESRYYNCTRSGGGRGRGSKIPISVDHVFDGAPDHIMAESVNPTAVINSMARLLMSCYQHNGAHSNLNMGNWPNCRVR